MYTGEPMPRLGVLLMANHGVDLTGHLSTQVTEYSVARADIILGMTREHVREVVALSPEAWPKTFTLKDFVRRTERVGPRHRHQRVADWLESLGAERAPYDVLGADPDDDVIDPFRRRAKVWTRVIDEVDELAGRIVPTLGLGGLSRRDPVQIAPLMTHRRHRWIFRLGRRSPLEWATTEAGGSTGHG